MQKFTSWVVLFILVQSFMTSTSRAAECKICNEYSTQTLCFISTKMGLMTPLARLSEDSVCPLGSLKYKVAHQSEILQILENFKSQSCVRFEKIIFFSHGNNQEIRNMFEVDQWFKLKAYQCLFKDGAMVDTRACNVGKSCDGALQMFRIANNIFGSKSGQVLSPVDFTFAVTGRPESIWGNSDRLLIYNSLDQRTYFTDQHGKSLQTTKEIMNECQNSLDEVRMLANKKIEKKDSLKCRAHLENVLRSMEDLNESLYQESLPDFFKRIDNLPFKMSSFKSLKIQIQQSCQ